MSDYTEMKKISILLILLISIFLAGCATLPPPKPIERTAGIYHQVSKGETLSHIAKIYNLDVEKIARVNRLSNKDKIDVGQFLFIPGAYSYQKSLLYKPTHVEKNFIWPLKSKICCFFGSIKKKVKNKGIDIEAKEGTIIVAAKSGRVTLAANNMKGYGKVIIIDHSQGYQTVYAYNSENLVRAGQFVTQDAPIAKVGSSGRAERPCLHFEIRKDHQPCNPLYYLPQYSGN